MYADFKSLEAISALVNIVLAVITFVLAKRTKNNAWNELFAAKLLAFFLFFSGLGLFSSYMQGGELWTGPSTYSLYQVPEQTDSVLFFSMLENVARSAEIAILCMIPLFFPYPFLQTANSKKIVSGFILIFTLFVSGLYIFYPYETWMIRLGLHGIPILLFGLTYVRFSLKELRFGDENARVISSASGLLAIAFVGYWLTDWLLWLTIPERWSTPVWVANIDSELNPTYFFIARSLLLGSAVTVLLAMFIGEGLRASRKGNSVLTSVIFAWFIVGIISFIADYSIFDTLEDCMYATCDGLPESWLIYNTFTNTTAGYLVQPLLLMYVLLNYNLVDTSEDGNGLFARAMVIVLVVIASSTLIEMIQSIIPIGEIITSAVLAIGIAAAIGWERRIMEKFLQSKESTTQYLDSLGEIQFAEFADNETDVLQTSVLTIIIFGLILSILNSALKLG